MKTYYEIISDDNGFTDTLETFTSFSAAFQYLKACLTTYIESFEYSVNNTFSVAWYNDCKGFTITEKDSFGGTWDYSVIIDTYTE